jgi:hypothetical protein
MGGILKTEWRKCLSVTYGGKPFFYYHGGFRWWIMWDRLAREWAVYDYNNRVIKTGFSSAIKAANSVGEFNWPTKPQEFFDGLV